MTKLFGTNGIRGVVNEDMNGLLALNIGKAWGTLLKRTISRPNVAIGTDARLSNHMLKCAITAGLLSTGCDVVDVGLVPTPTLQYTVKEKDFDSGVIITASHNPPHFNGIKGVASDGTEFSKDIEEEIEKIYFDESYSLVDWKDVGKLTKWDGANELYINGILDNVDVDLIKKKQYHVVLDCGNGAGSLVTPILLKKLGCKLTGAHGDFSSSITACVHIYYTSRSRFNACPIFSHKIWLVAERPTKRMLYQSIVLCD